MLLLEILVTNKMAGGQVQIPLFMGNKALFGSTYFCSQGIFHIEVVFQWHNISMTSFPSLYSCYCADRTYASTLLANPIIEGVLNGVPVSRNYLYGLHLSRATLVSSTRAQIEVFLHSACLFFDDSENEPQVIDGTRLSTADDLINGVWVVFPMLHDQSRMSSRKRQSEARTG